MKKLVSLLLALCMMCSAWTAVAEEWPTVEYEIGGFVLQIPEWCNLDYYQENEHGAQASFHGDVYKIETRVIDKELPEEIYCHVNSMYNGVRVKPETKTEAAYLEFRNSTFRDGYYLFEKNIDIGMYNGDPACLAIWKDPPDVRTWMDLSFYDNGTLIMLTTTWSDDLMDEAIIMLNVYDLRAEILSSARPADMTEEELLAKQNEIAEQEAARAEAKKNVLHGEKEEVKLGSITFQIPMGLKELWKHDTGASYESDILTVTLYTWTVDDEWARRLMDELSKQGIQFTFQQAALVGNLAVHGLDADTALSMADSAVEEDIGMLNGDPILNASGGFSSGNALLAQTYRGKTFSVFVTSETMTTEEAETIARDIMLSVRIDGVTEEDMIADSQADYVVITADSGKIRTEASISGGLIKTAYKGETYELIEKSGDWYVIKVDGRTGYLHSGVAKIQ